MLAPFPLGNSPYFVENNTRSVKVKFSSRCLMSTFPCLGKPPKTWQAFPEISAPSCSPALDHQQQERLTVEQPVPSSPCCLPRHQFPVPQFTVPFTSHYTPGCQSPSVFSVFSVCWTCCSPSGARFDPSPFHLCRVVSVAEMGVPQSPSLQSWTGSPISPRDLAQLLLPDINCMVPLTTLSA